MQEQVPVLIGEAAKSYVELKWMEFYFGVVLVVVLCIFAGYVMYKIMMDQ